MDHSDGLALLRLKFPDITGLTIEEWQEDKVLDVLLRAGGINYSIEYKAAATTEQIRSALVKLKVASKSQTIPLLVVPHMGDAGRELCRDANISWIDLSGNADIVAPQLRIRILGEPNKYKRSGRPESLFASKSARAARIFLLDIKRVWQQTELAIATGLSASYLSRLLPRYEEAGFIIGRQEGRSLLYSVTDPNGLLDAWYADYNFEHHTIIRGHVAARSGTELLREFSTTLEKNKIEYAATGLAGAWMWEPFAAFRTVTIYIPDHLDKNFMMEIGFHEGIRGSNTWLVVPDDPGVFTGAEERDGIRCVSPVQTYLDLKGQPERAEEARVELRRLQLDWKNKK